MYYSILFEYYDASLGTCKYKNIVIQIHTRQGKKEETKNIDFVIPSGGTRRIESRLDISFSKGGKRWGPTP